MYNATPAVADAWRALIERVSANAGVPLDVIDYPAPAPLADLWDRPDMGAVFMCGWPFQKRRPGPQIVAAPVPTDPDCTGPTYCTDMVVRADAPFRTIEDTFGGRIAWTDRGSQSGFNAPRHFLMRYRDGDAPLYKANVGPLITPRASLGAVLDGTADVAPLDSYFHLLLQRHDPETASRLRVIARTECTPAPVLVAAAEIDPGIVGALGDAFEAVTADPTFASVLHDLCLRGFSRIDDPSIYAITDAWDAEARAAGYDLPG
ncbi:phosphate/phosphite/phosphonate ABC transporter substrate-binding protein [Chachezhania antarctica]|uniref:phosphate/phosphite/phosphonate ABC transporter substrate-binding protein n=1 Tax=Chachezhania antarctica TaxID=2340860 RepID=UPI0019697377|nr:PhnD/SsuA/transferrin family substrate-binding protein [Chachezhania antarctica]|tara:strand:- start:7441 stop:8226 length:786 start_codon:yes stop_codon:yes gene_type:complete